MRVIALGFITLLAVLGTAGLSHAEKPITVGTGTPGSCTEMALKDALVIAETVGGGTIRFRCGREPVTISLTQVAFFIPTEPPEYRSRYEDGFSALLVIPDNVVIEGNGLITLEGRPFATIVYIDEHSTVELRGLTFQNGGTVLQYEPGAIYNEGALTIKDSAFLHNITFSNGGAIVSRGPLTVERTTFFGNGCAFGFGGAIVGFDLTIRHSVFDQNGAEGGGGALTGAGTIESSTFTRNRSSDGSGGALLGSFTIDRSTFADNSAAWDGGAIMGSPLTITRSAFTGNTASFSGGAISTGHWGWFYQESPIVIEHSVFSGNIAQNSYFGGGALFVNPDHLTLRGDEFFGNLPNDLGPVLP